MISARIDAFFAMLIVQLIILLIGTAGRLGC